MNVFDYIKAYCKIRNIQNYSVKSKVLTLDDMNKNFTFAPGVAFFYRFTCTGEILNSSDFGKPFLRVNTPSDFYDFAKICCFEDSGTLQKAYADFIFSVENTMSLTLESGANALFQSIKTAQLYYIYLNILPASELRQQARKEKESAQSQTGRQILIDITH